MADSSKKNLIKEKETKLNLRNDEEEGVGQAEALRLMAQQEECKVFFEEDFNANRVANNIISSNVIASSLEMISTSISSLEQELHDQVAAHHEDLLSQATGVEKLDEVLKVVLIRVSGLQESMARIRDKIEKPYHVVLMRNTQLARLQETCEYLRKTIRYVEFAKRLRALCKGTTRELVKITATLNDIAALNEGGCLAGIGLVDAQATWVEETRKEVLAQCAAMLNEGISSLNPTHVGTALLSYHNLGILKQQVESIVDDLVREVKEALDLCLSPPHEEGNQRPNVTALRAHAWTQLERVCDVIVSTSAKSKHVQRVLCRKKDPSTQTRLLDELFVEKGIAPSASYWSNVCALLSQTFDRLNSENTLSFAGELPKLLRMVNELWRRIVSQQGLETPQIVLDKELAMLRSSVTSFESTYLSRCLSRMYDAVNLIFPQSSSSSFALPSPDDVISLCKGVARELSSGLVDNNLVMAVAKIVAQSVQLYCMKSDEMFQKILPTLDWHKGNPSIIIKAVHLANRAWSLEEGIKGVLSSMSNLPPAASAIIAESFLRTSAIRALVLEGVFLVLTNRTAVVLASLHNEEYSVENGDDATCSTYVLTLQSDLQLMHREIFTHVLSKDHFAPRVQGLAKHIMTTFVRHVTMLAPAHPEGSTTLYLRIAADMAQLELALGVLEGPAQMRVADMGVPYKALRALRPLLFLETHEIASHSSVGTTLPYSAVVHHLFGRASGALVAPYRLHGNTPQKYATWMQSIGDETTRERLCIERALHALESYAQSIQARGEKQYIDVYPLLMSLVSRGQQALNPK